MARINIHPSLIRFTNQQSSSDITSKTIEALVGDLCKNFPKLSDVILEDNGNLSPYVNIYVNGTSIKELPSEQELLQEDNVDVLTALVGG